MVYPLTTEDEIKRLAKPLIGSLGPNFQITDHERFKAKFGVTITIATRVWNMIVLELNNGVSVRGFSRLSPVNVLHGLFFMKVYPTARQVTGMLGSSIVGSTQFRKYSQFIIRRIAALSNEVVSSNY